MKPIPVNTPELTESDRRAVLECLESGWVSGDGPQVPRFEAGFATAIGRAHGIAVSSGTAGLDIAVRALGLGPGDEVLVPSLTIISCAQAIVASGARPVPVDCDGHDWNSHLEHFQARLTERTRAIVLVHLYGLCADLDPILEWARAHGLAVIEDASQALGLDYRAQPCGSFGDVAVFSLYANKLITTGEGGMLLCSSAAIADRCRSLRNLCHDPGHRFRHEELGWNYRMTAMQAALGNAQLPRLAELALRKRRQGELYNSAFRELSVFELAPDATPFACNAYWVFGMVVGTDAPFTRDEITAALASRGIGTRTFFHGLHLQPALVRPELIDRVSLPVTESVGARGFYLPGGLGLRDDDQQRVVSEVRAFVASRT